MEASNGIQVLAEVRSGRRDTLGCLMLRRVLNA
jgi:hypothetical protein